jgi:hypothetical protein
MPITRKQWDELKRQADAGDAEAQWEVGAWYEDGLTAPDGSVIVRCDPRSAVRWYRRSAEAGNASAQINLGNCLSTGRGVRRDDAEALRWYKRALRQGDASAPNNIATVHRDRGDERRAMLWFRRAIVCGDGDALVEVGRRLYVGLGVRPDADEAVQFFRCAIRSKNITEAGREEAMFCLGVAYHDGRGVRRSPSLAIKWLSRSNQDRDRPEAEELIQQINDERRRTR